MTFVCCDERRLDAVKLLGSANGIEYLEVRDHLEPDATLRQRTLFVRLLRTGFTLTRDNVRVDGGACVAVVPIEWVAPADALPAGVDPALVDEVDDPPRTLVVRTAVSGDFSRYTLRLRASIDSDQPPPGFDPRLSAIDFSFKVECPSRFDCATARTCPPIHDSTPEIDYLARDYTGLRRLMLDRLNLLAPGWTERSAADLGMALVELLAYAADHLSYQQDAIAAEAYLATARRRVSVRRHARLVDYAMHDGCNARAWVHVEVSSDYVLPAATPLLTGGDELPVRIEPGSQAWREALAAGAIVFETAQDRALFVDLNVLRFYTWGDQACCLPRGATAATLRDHHPSLRPGDVLVFEEVCGPRTLLAADADPAKRWTVRLTAVDFGIDPSGQLFDEPPVDGPEPITQIDWDRADALPFPLCLSVEDAPGKDISLARGNVVLADHGRSISNENVGTVDATSLIFAAVAGSIPCASANIRPIPVRFRPTLDEAPLSNGFDLAEDLEAGAPGDDIWMAASGVVSRDPHDAAPLVALSSQFENEPPMRWRALRDLLESDGDDAAFVVETDDDGTAVLRFGDDEHGRRPPAGTTFRATYRVGNGTAGNIGADTLTHVVCDPHVPVAAVRNPMAAGGGIDPEDIDAVRRDAPEAFRTQDRAVTAADYAAAAERRRDVQRAAATFRWTGSWYTVFVTADRFGGAAVDDAFRTRLGGFLERFRMAGYDLDVAAPRYVALDVALHVCVNARYLRSDVLREVAAALGSGVLPDGRRALFHPDNFSFADPVYASRLVAAAQAVDGVDAVWVERFQRLADPDPSSLASGVIPIGRLEIAQLANDPSFPERGRLAIVIGGGR